MHLEYSRTKRPGQCQQRAGLDARLRRVRIVSASLRSGKSKQWPPGIVLNPGISIPGCGLIIYAEMVDENLFPTNTKCLFDDEIILVQVRKMP
jgi:hypothetical protein